MPIKYKKGDFVSKEPKQSEHHESKSAAADNKTCQSITCGEAQVKSRLIDNMAYQIRTLSNAVIGFSDLLLSENLTEDQIEYVQEIHHAGYGLSTLINEVLDWTQVLSGKIQMHKNRCELAEVIQQITPVLSVAAEKKGLDYQITTDPMLPVHILSDSERLVRCLLNLIANAVRYTPNGLIQVHIYPEENDRHELVVCFDIIDSGIGIEPEKMVHLFEPGDYQLDSDQGLLTVLDMGLRVTAGLPLTLQLCELLDGTLQAESQVGAGSTFTLKIPAGINSTASTTPFAYRNQQSTVEMPATVLLVEDQQSNRTVISLILESLGAEVQTAVDGEDSLEKVQDQSFSLILMDLKMPKMDGYEAAQRLREKGVGAPIIALSAKVLCGGEHRKIAELFDGFVTKPVDSRKLSEMLEQFIPGFSGAQDLNESPEQKTAALEYGN
jgi:CheY-like chemotaxis protein